MHTIRLIRSAREKDVYAVLNVSIYIYDTYNTYISLEGRNPYYSF